MPTAMNGPVRCADCGRLLPAPTDGGAPFAWCMTCTASRLREHGEVLAQRLLPSPNGHWAAGRLWRCGDSSGREGDSLAVYLDHSEKHGRWRDYATADEHGDLLDLIQISPHTGCHGDKIRALRWAHEFLRAPTPAPAVGAKSGARRRERTPEEKRIKALQRWHEASPLAPDDLAWRYLAERREIDLSRLPELPVLRFHPALWNEEAQRPFPALVAAVVGPNGRFITIHRIWLLEQRGIVDKAPVEKPKKAYGPYAGGCIPLTRGASGRPWLDPAPGERLGLTEGVENGLIVAQERPAWRCAAAVSVGNIRGMHVPAAIAEIMLVADNDEPGSEAAKALEQGVQYFREELGKKVKVLRPRNRAIKDVNDLARWLRARHAGV
jgi:hypothetical protein